MKKYLVIDETTGNGDVYTEVYATAEDANTKAAVAWDYLTAAEKKGRHIYVGFVEDSTEYLYEGAFDEDEGTDYSFFHSLGTEEGFFDSGRAE